MIKDSAIAIVGAKGQIVIPQPIRRELAITPSTKLSVYRKDDKIVLVKLNNLPLVEVKEQIKLSYEKSANIKVEKEQLIAAQTKVESKTPRKRKKSPRRSISKRTTQKKSK